MSVYKLFPCLPGSKHPALPGDWRGHATADESQIQAWLDQGYNLAIDAGASGLCVIDLDGGEVGEDSWKRLQAEHGTAPTTFEVRTPRGGRHLYYVGQAPSSVQRLGPKVDTRGTDGYFLVPPSTTADGVYSVERSAPVAALPAWVAPALAISKAAAPSTGESLDQSHSVARAIAWLQAQPEVSQGSGADAKTFEAACHLRDLGLSGERSVALMLEYYRCTPQDDRFEAFITRKVENCWSYAQNDPGAWAVAPAETRFAGALDHLPPAAVGGGDLPNPFKLWRVKEALERPPPKWIMPGTIPREVLLALYGPPDVGKSWLAIDLCLHIASGLAGWGRPESEPEDVIYFCGEGFSDMVHNRIVAWCRAKGVPVDEISDRLRLLENFPDVTSGERLKQLSDAINAEHLRPALIVLDTYARVMAESGLGENDPKEVMLLVREAERLKRGFRCTVMPIHHSGKDLERGPRGSNSLIAAVDVAYEMSANWPTMAFQLRCERMKIAIKPEAMHFEARPAKSGLVFEPISVADYRILTSAGEALDGKRIGGVLQALGAVGADKAVTTSTLVAQLYQGPADEAPEDTIKARDRLVRQLNAAAKSKLAAYCEREIAGWAWQLPAQ